MTTPNIPNIKKDQTPMSGFKALVSKRMTMKVTFMDEEVEIGKLSVRTVMEIQEQAKKEDDTNGMTMLRMVIKSSVPEAGELSDEDFETFPMDELGNLSNSILKFSGINPDAATPGEPD
jgi:hypothetical protein